MTDSVAISHHDDALLWSHQAWILNSHAVSWFLNHVEGLRDSAGVK